MAEILHQLIGGLSHYFPGSIHTGGAGFLPSTVVYFGRGTVLDGGVEGSAENISQDRSGIGL